MYRHTQTAYAMVSVMLLLVALPVGVVLRVPPAPGLIFGRIIALLVFVIVAVCAAIFSRMSVTVEGGELSWNFAFGRLRKSVPLAEITRVEAVRTSVVDGWGIHLTSRGWLYNVSGFDAVWIQLRSGRQFLVGTDRPSQLVDAIEAGRSSFATGRGAPAEEGGSAQRTSHRRAPAFSRAVQSSRRGLRRAETPMTMMSVDELIAKAVEAGLCAARPLRGCSRSEIERLERDSGHSLPAS